MNVIKKLNHPNAFKYARTEEFDRFMDDLQTLEGKNSPMILQEKYVLRGQMQLTTYTLPFPRLQELHDGGGFYSEAFEQVAKMIPDDEVHAYSNIRVFQHPTPKSTGLRRFIPNLTRVRGITARQLMARLLLYGNRISPKVFLREYEKDSKDVDELFMLGIDEDADGLFKVGDKEEVDGLFNVDGRKKQEAEHHDEADGLSKRGGNKKKPDQGDHDEAPAKKKPRAEGKSDHGFHASDSEIV